LTKREDGELVLDDGLDSNSVEKDDDDVAEERIKVNDPASGLKDNASVFIAELWKVYAPSIGILSSFLRCLKKIICCCFRRNSEAKDDKTAMPKRAVRGLSTAIMPGETFGLLGVNGAGKTTTLSILTGDINPTSGDAYVTGNDVTGRTPGGVSKARKSIGFCPQVDPLLELMTGRDTLLMFGRLRGIPAERLHETVDDLIESLTLTPHANKKSGSYSGGNKRKLSLGVAIIGNPNVLFIDEASSGMDPVARRKMWDIISTIAQHRSVILTTHSMEEAEALCTRVAIMTSGRMRCLGSVTHLKNKFLDGYTVDIQCWNNAGEDDVDVVEKYVLEEAFKQNERRVVLAERHGVFLRFDVENHRREGRDGNGGGTGEIFRQMEEMKRNSDMFAIEDYSIAQCTLEQVFLRLAKDDDNGDDDA
jgi:ATP-binding cassette subfamily A (ABC1) protein 3